MNRFDDLLQRVSLLNVLLKPIAHDLGSETRMILHRQLWRIVDQLNQELALDLDNTSLDLTAREESLAIHYFSGIGGSTSEEVTLIIDRSLRVERHTKNLATGTVTMSGISSSQNMSPPAGPSTAAVLTCHEAQRQEALNATSWPI